MELMTEPNSLRCWQFLGRADAYRLFRKARAMKELKWRNVLDMMRRKEATEIMLDPSLVWMDVHPYKLFMGEDGSFLMEGVTRR